MQMRINFKNYWEMDTYHHPHSIKIKIYLINNVYYINWKFTVVV